MEILLPLCPCPLPQGGEGEVSPVHHSGSPSLLPNFTTPPSHPPPSTPQISLFLTLLFSVACLIPILVSFVPVLVSPDPVSLSLSWSLLSLSWSPLSLSWSPCLCLPVLVSSVPVLVSSVPVLVSSVPVLISPVPVLVSPCLCPGLCLTLSLALGSRLSGRLGRSESLRVSDRRRPSRGSLGAKGRGGGRSRSDVDMDPSSATAVLGPARRATYVTPPSIEADWRVGAGGG
jgi:hypothetical protein